MGEKISRRNFLKMAGISAAAGLALTGCGTNARFVKRNTYLNMPEYTLPGTSTYYASTCGECPAGCGIVVRTTEGRALKIEGNPDHPVNKGKTCARGQTAVQGLYNPDRFQTAVHQSTRGSGKFDEIKWDGGITVVASALQTQNPAELAFLTGLAPDHLFDLWRELTSFLGIPEPLRYTGLAMLEGRATLARACENLYGLQALPHFDIADADIILSFGANFTETWLTPVAYSLAYGEMRQGDPARRGYLVQFEPRMSMTAANADEWFPINPGSEAMLAGALGSAIREILGLDLGPQYQNIDRERASHVSGVSLQDIDRLAHLFVDAQKSLAIPGSVAMGQSNGQQTAEAVLALNGLVDSSGGGLVTFAADSPLTGIHPASTLADVESLVQRMNSGGVKVLFIHNTNPVFTLPESVGFEAAMKNVPLIISFASYPDETSLLADYVLPDHMPLESWGYQNLPLGSEVRAVSGLQPVVSPFHDTRATVDVFLAAIQQVGGRMSTTLPYTDEVAFIQNKVVELNSQGGFYAAADDSTFWTLWQQAGGWWQKENSLQTLNFNLEGLNTQTGWREAEFDGSGQYPYFLLVYPSQNLTDGTGANRPWLQENPDPMTTALWDTWVEVNMETAHELGLENDDIIRLITPEGEITAIVYLYPAIRPDVFAVPAGQGHHHFGMFASKVGNNPFKLIQPIQNQAGDLAYAGTKVRIEKTGKKKQLPRKESIPGVYGEEAG